MILLPTFSMKSPKAIKTSGPEDTGERRDADENKRDKKRGKGNDNVHSLVKNEFPHGEIFMLANETGVAKFAGKQLDQRPQWNDKCKCCPCWFLQKYCFSDCPNEESHVPAKKVPPTILQKMLTWVKACLKWRVGSESSDVRPLSKNTPHSNFDGLPHQIHHRATSQNTPVSRAKEPSAQMPQLKKSDALKLGLSAGKTCLGEYSLLQTNISSSQETATDGIKKWKHSPTKILMELDLKNFGETSTAPPRSNVNLSQHHETVLPQGPNHHTQHHESSQHHERVLLQGPNHHTQHHESSQHHEIVLPQGPNHHTQHHESSQHHEIVLPQGPNHQHENTSGATPSSVWPSDLITILQQIAELPCHQPSKPLFTFKFSLEAANKNFILLTRKFGGDLSKALLAQSDSPLGYGSEFKPIETLELTFRNHPS
jgi:hypothetical protein